MKAIVCLLLLSACGGSTVATTQAAQVPTTDPPSGLQGAHGFEFPPAPAVRAGSLTDETQSAAESLVANVFARLDLAQLELVAESGDARLGWLLSDLLRFTIGADGEALTEAFTTLTGADVSSDAISSWQVVTDHLIAWDLPAPPGYQELKRRLYTQLEPRWEPFFSDPDAQVDWRHVSWGGVFIDDRPAGDDGFCSRGCIPSLDDPLLTTASEGDWYADSSIVFGLEVNGEAVAFPKNMMEVHEMVNLDLGGRRLGIPYCTLCGSAQAYFTDQHPDRSSPLVLRTSGLLIRSNKMMYDLGTFSLIDTFRGTATSGPLLDAGVELEQASVVGSTWGDWKETHPDTMIVAEGAGLGRVYPEDPLQGRDAAGPIFPVGDVDPRLGVHELVVGVLDQAGNAVAFPLAAAQLANEAGQQVAHGGVRLLPAGSGFVAVADDGAELVAHQSFWFAWSQFHPTTELWAAP